MMIMNRRFDLPVIILLLGCAIMGTPADTSRPEDECQHKVVSDYDAAELVDRSGDVLQAEGYRNQQACKSLEPLHEKCPACQLFPHDMSVSRRVRRAAKKIHEHVLVNLTRLCGIDDSKMSQYACKVSFVSGNRSHVFCVNQGAEDKLVSSGVACSIVSCKGSDTKNWQRCFKTIGDRKRHMKMDKDNEAFKNRKKARQAAFGNFKDLQNQADEAQKASEEADEEMEMVVFAYQNSINRFRQIDEIDLHGMWPEEALEIVVQRINYVKKVRKGQKLTIITGQGHHSTQAEHSKIKQGVLNMLRHKDCKFPFSFQQVGKGRNRHDNEGAIEICVEHGCMENHDEDSMDREIVKIIDDVKRSWANE